MKRGNQAFKYERSESCNLYQENPRNILRRSTRTDKGLALRLRLREVVEQGEVGDGRKEVSRMVVC